MEEQNKLSNIVPNLKSKRSIFSLIGGVITALLIGFLWQNLFTLYVAIAIAFTAILVSSRLAKKDGHLSSIPDAFSGKVEPYDPKEKHTFLIIFIPLWALVIIGTTFFSGIYDDSSGKFSSPYLDLDFIPMYTLFAGIIILLGSFIRKSLQKGQFFGIALLLKAGSKELFKK